MIEWVLIATVGALGPYPVALKSYPERTQCVQAANVAFRTGEAIARCIPIMVPKAVRRPG